MKKHWPVPSSKNRKLPINGERGSFWEDRKDRHHAGVDIYAPCDCEVVAIEDGEVVDVAVFTSPQLIHYWFVTYSVMIRAADGKVHRYAEMKDTTVKTGDKVKGGQVIGHVGKVLNLDAINETSPGYIQKLKSAGDASMLHFEMHSGFPQAIENYKGGNYFLENKPDYIEDPTAYLRSIITQDEE